MKDHDKAGSEIHGFILFKKQPENNIVCNRQIALTIVHGMKETLQKRTAMEEKSWSRELMVNIQCW